MKLLLALLVFVVSVAGCGSDDAAVDNPPVTETTTTFQAVPSSASDPDKAAGSDVIAELLAATAKHRVFDENSFGGQDVFDRINVIDSVAKPNSNGFLTPDPASLLGDEERAAIAQALAPLDVTWVPSFQAVVGDAEDPDYRDVGAILTLGAPEFNGGQAEVASELWCGGLCGIGGTHVLERDASGVWAVTGTTGESWIS